MRREKCTLTVNHDQCLSPVGEFFSESEIGDFQVAVAIQQEILRFQIAINDVLSVQVV